MLRSVVIVLVVLFALAANYQYGLVNNITRDYDIRYIAENCGLIRPDQAANIMDHITYDRSMFGNLYIFDQVPGEFTKSDFKAASRGIFSELLCFPVLGCVLPPTMSKGC